MSQNYQQNIDKPTLIEVGTIIQSVFPLVDALAGRWQDEQQYEDIADYQALIQKNLPRAVKVLRMKRRPFGFVFDYRGVKGEVVADTKHVMVRLIPTRT